MRVGHFLFFYRQISQDLNMLQNSFGHTIERRCRCESRTIRNKEFCADRFVWWNLLGRDMVFPSYIFIHGGGPNYFLYHLRLEVGKRGMGQCVRNSVYGTFSILIAFYIKAFFAKFEGIIAGIIYGYFVGITVFGMGLMAPVIKSALHLPKETIVTTICILYYMVFIAYSVSYAVNSNKVEQEGQEKTNYSNK